MIETRWSRRQIDEAKGVWARVQLVANFHFPHDPDFRQWKLLAEPARQVLLADRAGLPIELIAWLSGMSQSKASATLAIAKAICRLPVYSVPADKLVARLPVFSAAPKEAARATHH